MAVKKGFIERVTDEHVREMLSLIPQNIFRLLRDAILLYDHSSYPSAFALATYSLEELGKAFAFITILNPAEKPAVDQRLLILDKAFSDHTNKQREALKFISEAIEEIKSSTSFNSLLWGISDKYDDEKLSTIYQRILYTFKKVELRKRRSIYVDLDKQYRPTFPEIKRDEAFDIIETCLDALTILLISATSPGKNAWLGNLLYSAGFERFPPDLEELLDLSLRLSQQRLEGIVKKASDAHLYLY
ncbi:MAG: AbiV family abortive infection protein [Actinobacteria bacterium]|nr:AbiV family abortive infection protein [Actinomycetota bacterium]